MNKNEKAWDKVLNIKTTGQDYSKANFLRYAYEPTPYPVLERLANSGYIGKRDVILDYGCGKGRVDFFLSYHTRAKSIGIEYDERIYEIAIKNQEKAISGHRVCFINQDAEDYLVPTEVNRIYFFNPFSVKILKIVMTRIMESYYQEPREILLFFYYPSTQYISYLTTIDEVEYVDEIYCSDLYNFDNPREKIMILKIY